jgi:hypothetical protein
LAEVERECHSSGRETNWKVFYAKVVAPIVENTEAPPLKELCTKYGIESEAKASYMIFTLKSQFRSAMGRHLRQLVQSDLEVEDEFREIFEILSKNKPR